MSFSIVGLPWLPEPPADFSARCKAIAASGKDCGKEIQLLAGFRLNARQSLSLGRALEQCRRSDLDIGPLSEFRLGLVSNGTVDLVTDCLPAACARHGVAVQISSAPFDQVVQQ